MEDYLLTWEQVRDNEKAILAKAGKRGRGRRVWKIVLAAAILAALLAVAAFGYAQSKYNILHLSGHSIIYMGEKNNKKVKSLTVEYVPEGFVLTDEEKHDEIIGREYYKDTLFFSIQKSSINDNQKIDNEYGEIKSLEIEGTEYIIYGGESYTGIIWVKDDFEYSLVGNCNETEMLKIALSVR